MLCNVKGNHTGKDCLVQNSVVPLQGNIQPDSFDASDSENYICLYRLYEQLGKHT